MTMTLLMTWSTNLMIICDNDDDDNDIFDDALVPTQSVQSVTWCNNFFVARFFQIQGLAILHTHTHRQKWEYNVKIYQLLSLFPILIQWACWEDTSIHLIVVISDCEEPFETSTDYFLVFQKWLLFTCFSQQWLQWLLFTCSANPQIPPSILFHREQYLTENGFWLPHLAFISFISPAF